MVVSGFHSPPFFTPISCICEQVMKGREERGVQGEEKKEADRKPLTTTDPLTSTRPALTPASAS